jgi:alpha-glucan,water dikinase
VAAAAAADEGVESLEAELQELRSLVHQLQPPASLQQQLTQQLSHLAAAGAAATGSSSSSSDSHPSDHSLYHWSNVWCAVKSVWASQWNSRAVAALSKAQLPLDHLRMGVLLQPLLPARYSWVAHTVNPSTGSAADVAVQLVVGLGEVLVGNHPGRAFGGVVKRASLTAALEKTHGGSSSSSSSSRDVMQVPSDAVLLDVVDVVSYPSKNAAVVPGGVMLLPCSLSASGSSSTASGSSSGMSGSSSSRGVVFMARSDSNAEDLPGFAGAGLFDSVSTTPTDTHLINYTLEPLVWDRAAAAALMWQCALAAVAAEQVVVQQQQQGMSDLGHGANLGQDVEGCVTADGRIWLLQARPQV